MQVDMNNLRKQAIYAYNRLCNTMKENLHSDVFGDIVNIDIHEISQDMDDLRMCLVTLACCYNEGDEDFKEVIDEVGDIAVLIGDELAAIPEL